MEYDTLAIGLRKALELDTDVFTPQRLQMVTEQDIQGWIQLAGPITTNNTNSKDNTTNTVQYHTMPNVSTTSTANIFQIENIYTLYLFCTQTKHK